VYVIYLMCGVHCVFSGVLLFYIDLMSVCCFYALLNVCVRVYCSYTIIRVFCPLGGIMHVYIYVCYMCVFVGVSNCLLLLIVYMCMYVCMYVCMCVCARLLVGVRAVPPRYNLLNPIIFSVLAELV
jgi:hypothetical protein